jgi:hypothetical protein
MACKKSADVSYSLKVKVLSHSIGASDFLQMVSHPECPYDIKYQTDLGDIRPE